MRALVVLILALTAAPVAASAQSRGVPDLGTLARTWARTHPAPRPVAAIPAVTAADRVLGQTNAPVTVIEYASLTCSHCGDWHADVYPAFKRQFIDTGKVKMIFRDFPTDPAPVSARAAGIARCAVPARFYAVVDAFYDQQQTLFDTNATAPWYAAGIAASGRTPAQIEACLADPATLASIRASAVAADAAGVQGTPTFVVNGRIVADRSLAGLTAAINPLLPAGRR